ncbi:MAG: ABC transporter ATP-binding protein, partial [Pseudomonadota bacterium]
MERNLYKYIWSHTWRDQAWIVAVTLLAMIPYYMSFDLPKQIINHPITGIGFERAGATLPFLKIEVDLPLIGSVSLFQGIELERIPFLFALSLAFLALVIVNGLIKVYINTYKGQLGERLLRRIRFELMDRILRFPPKRFKRVKAGEVASMVKDEVEPFGGFSGEAFASPVMLAGQTLTAMLFIFVQHVGLGTVALIGALVQVLVIPKLRARLIVLGRQRQLRARELAGRVTEIVDGIDTIRGNDATNYVRADLTERLGRIFKIRYDIYQWKFFVKFLNNTIAQVTPFIFYSFGGYLAIIGTVDVGQLVAVINAYKELPGPMKSLIDYDLARQDIQVKYETVLNQFDVVTLIDEDIQKVDPSHAPFSDPTLEARSLTLSSDGGTPTLERANIRLEHGQAVALIGTGGSGAAELAEAIGRITWPTEGSVEVGDRDILELPDAISGRQITYASPKEFFFSGTLKDNLLLGLKNAPRVPAEANGRDSEYYAWWWHEAELSGNPVLNLNDNWIDEATILRHTGADTVEDAIDTVLGIVRMEDEISRLALRCPLDPAEDADFAEMLIGMRRSFADELARRGLQDLVVPFDPARYNDAATIGENIFFGHPVRDGAVR